MLNILFMNKTHTYLNKNIKITLQSCFYPGPQRLAEIVTNSKLLIPKPLNIGFSIPNALSIKSVTTLCPKIKYPGTNLHKLNYDRIDKTHFMQNKELNDILSKISTSKDSTLSIKNEMQLLSEKFFDNNIDSVKDELLVEGAGTPNQYGVYTRFSFALKQKDVYSEEDFEQFVENWYLLFYLLNLNAMIRRFMNKWSPYITLYTSSLYLIAFSYKVYYLFIL